MVNGANNKRIYILIAGFLLLISSILFLKLANQKVKMDKNLTYIITESKLPDSFDPLDADSSNNLPVMRMLYSSIIQINASNELFSLVLESFNYNPSNKTITFKVIKNQKFDDETFITPEDIVLPILRVALKNQNFPLIKDIVGIDEWKLLKMPLGKLPRGIKIEGNTIEIQLVKHFINPLFRFCLELFSVIPKKCVDLQSNKLICKMPAGSGFYKIQQTKDNEISFIKRILNSTYNEKVNYDQIKFKYSTLEKQCLSSISKNEIVSGNESSLSGFICNNKTNEQLKWLPASRFGVLLLNPNIPPFNQAKNRRLFSKKVRNYLENNYKDLTIEASIFTKILPGYLNRSQLEQEHFNLKDEHEFKGKKFYVPKLSQTIHKQTAESIIQVARSLEMDIVELDNAPGSESINKFLNNEASFMIGSSGFWAQDPIGDLSMFFSKDLHKPLKFVWQDKKMYELIKEIEDETDLIAVKIKMENLNRHLQDESLIAPVTHFRRLYITHESIKSLNLPMAVTSPAPWHLTPTE